MKSSNNNNRIAPTQESAIKKNNNVTASSARIFSELRQREYKSNKDTEVKRVSESVDNFIRIAVVVVAVEFVCVSVLFLCRSREVVGERITCTGERGITDKVVSMWRRSTLTSTSTLALTLCVCRSLCMYVFICVPVYVCLFSSFLLELFLVFIIFLLPLACAAI